MNLGGGLPLCSGTWLVTVPCTGLSTVPPSLASLSQSPLFSPSLRRELPGPPPTWGPVSDSAPSSKGDVPTAPSPVTAQTSAPSSRAVVCPDEGGGNTGLQPQSTGRAHAGMCF